MTKKVYNPPVQFAQKAHIPSESNLSLFRELALHQPDNFYKELAKALHFDVPYKQILEWNNPKAKWFTGAKLNVSFHCLDRHLESRSSKIALIWEGENCDANSKPLEMRSLTYKDLFTLTCQIANTLKAQGLKKGDRVLIYMPMVPECVASMLACARIGLVHSVVFGGFSPQAIKDRLHDSGAKMVICADGTYRRGKWISLKANVDEALIDTNVPSLVYRRDPKQECKMRPNDIAWDSSVLKSNTDCPYEKLDSEDPLFILYTSGTTGKPKGLYHTQAGYLLWAHWTTRWLFDIKPDDIYWCTADCGWITGHTYITYGPLSNGATQVIYEGGPLTPTPGRFWQIIERYGVSIFYTSPTAIRTFMKYDESYITNCDLDSLRLLGSVGEPINPEAWLWYHRNIGNERCPIVDTYWQTETGGAIIAPFPGASPLKPGSATKPIPGIMAEIRDPETGKTLPVGSKGALVITRPWPGMARGIWGDEERFSKTYWNTSEVLKGVYLTGDLAEVDSDGDFWVDGRMDDVLKVSGHRFGSAEVESALIEVEEICEAAVVGRPDAVKGQSVVAFVSLSEEAQKKIASGELKLEDVRKRAIAQVTESIGSFAKPDSVRLANALPKTRSGKIMRRLLRELAVSGQIKGDTTTLEDFKLEASMTSE